MGKDNKSTVIPETVKNVSGKKRVSLGGGGGGGGLLEFFVHDRVK